MSRKKAAYDITKTAMMLALALVLSILEAWLLPRGILPVPGFKLGLANIADRLRLIYGGEAGIRVFSDEEKRTVVQIDIPQKRP